ncbi:Stk1 family PASTA domain-containing Ser/Thr kinase [Alkaliphilus sp. MSJ-5]|uniref:non-specific serine/threonine protein kinase n=1 Tax=Alkaliphilus flagellatus TaxID=2841507 RepID=A0ABS6G4E0_9FIRM|nr:Stk1 family PASTA domain-containing Ser/Thr kinase [Alkaliphilus flagellatus]MBU5677365.1 Stk1 family PASTA domain-containing Ser/Thr kinase [Alkaliphilus flagellatus]
MIGKILGNRYEIVEKIGGGGMALVYKAKCNLLNRYVAIKVLRPEFINDKDLLDKFRKESQAAASLSHPNIVNVYDVGEEDGVYYIVMEYVDGKTLKELIKEKGKLSKNEILDFTRQIALALKHAHSNHIVHRDIKPHNILVTEDNRAKVTDFGIALAATSSTITNTGSIIGSVHYFAPEQARGGYTDEKSDLYSLGIVMYEMATGRVPFEGDAPITIALKHIQEKPEPPSKYNPSISKGLEAIIIKLTQKEQSARYANASALIEDLYKIKNNFDLDDIDNTLKIEDSPTQIIPMVTANEIRQLTDSQDEVKTMNIKNKKGKKDNSKKDNKRKLVIGSAIAAALVAALVFTFAFFYISDLFKVEDVKVPNFVGMNIEKAEKLAEDTGLRLNKSTEYNSKVPKDEIINQTTREGMMVRKGFEVKVIVSEGSKLVPVPDLRNENATNAERLLKDAGLEPGEVSEDSSDEYPIGTIIDQNPRQGVQVATGSAVNYVVSTGPKVQTFPMPNLLGKTLEEARSILKQFKLEEGSITEEYSDVYVRGYVMEQNIPADKEVSEGSVVNLVVSKGSDVPDQMEEIEEGEDQEGTQSSGTSTKSISINLEEYTGIVDIEIYQINGLKSKKVYSEKHNADEAKGPIRVNVKGSGTQQLAVYLNGEKQEPNVEVNF